MAVDVYGEHEFYGDYKLLRNDSDLQKALQQPTFRGGAVYDDKHFEVECLPHGVFLGHTKECSVLSVEFQPRLRKAEKAILDGVIALFRKDLSKEAFVKICYNKAADEYHIIEAVGEKTKTGIVYRIPFEKLLGKGLMQVMEIHSHNTMRAFFSSIDDEDESGFPGLFGVIGRLDQPNPEIRFRAGFKGKFCAVPTNVLFDI